MITTISATELKNNVSEILNNVYFTGNETVIERYGKPIAKIVPANKKTKENISEVIDRYFGAMPDFPEVTKFRRSGRRKTPPLL